MSRRRVIVYELISVSTLLLVNHCCSIVPDFGKVKKILGVVEQILEAATNETAVVRPLTSHLTNHPSKTSVTSSAELKKLGITHKRLSPMNFYTKTYQSEPICKKLHLSALCVRWVPSRGLLKNNEQWERMEGEREKEREIQGILCCRDTLKMMN